MSTFKKTFFLLFVFYMFPGECTVIYGQAGEDLTLSCGVPSHSNIEWKFNNVLLVYVDGKRGNKRKGPAYSASKYPTNKDTLKITNLDRNDIGSYTCTQSKVAYTVNVVSVSANPGTVLPQSSDVELNCNVHGDSKTEVKWLRPPNGQPYPEKKHVINLKSVTSNDDGQWTCQVLDSKINITLSVVGLQSKDVIEVPQGGDVVLPCSLPKRTSRSVIGGKWKADHLAEVSSSILNNIQNILQWKGQNTSRVIFTSGQLSTNYDIKLMKVQARDAGRFVCTVEFDGGVKLTANTMLTVTGTSAGVKVIISANGQTSVSGGSLTKNVLGIQLWIWIAIGASSVVVTGLIIVIVLVLRRNKRMKRRVRKLRSIRQPLTGKDYCQCNRSERDIEFVKQMRPVPVPRQQSNANKNAYY